MTVYSDLKSKVSRALQDPTNAVFDATAIEDMIAAAYADISAVAPRRFQEDIDQVADQLKYLILATDFPTGNDDIELRTVEIWDGSDTPATRYRWLTPARSHPTGLQTSQVGWQFWGGYLYLTTDQVNLLEADADYYLRVWGYSPWPLPTADDDTIALTAGAEEALVVCCYAEGLRRLTANRTLFKQWQTRSNNTDVSMASLMSDWDRATNDKEKRLRRLAVPRDSV